MRKMRISISRVRDPVLYAAYKELGPRGFSVEARKILEAYAMGQARPAKEIKHYQLYLGDADVCPYFYVGDAFYTLSETFPFRARAEITRAVLSMAFVSSMTSMPAVQALPQPSAGQLSAGQPSAGFAAASLAAPASAQQSVPQTRIQDQDTGPQSAPDRTDDEEDTPPEDDDAAMEDLASLFAGLDG